MSDQHKVSHSNTNYTSWPAEQRVRLAALMEKGLNSKLPRAIAEHPDVSPPFDFAFEGAILSAQANAIGFALMGLDMPFMEIWTKYMTEEQKDHPDYPNGGLAVAAQMLNMPYQLLWDAEFLCFLGFEVEGVIEELRR